MENLMVLPAYRQIFMSIWFSGIKLSLFLDAWQASGSLLSSEGIWREWAVKELFRKILVFIGIHHQNKPLPSKSSVFNQPTSPRSSVEPIGPVQLSTTRISFNYVWNTPIQMESNFQ